MDINRKINLFAVLVNYGDEQISYLTEVVQGLKSFKKYDVTIIVNSNIPLFIDGVDKVNVIRLEDYQLLPLTCRKTIWDNRDRYDLFIYGENDHLFLEKHIDKHLEYEKILPSNIISGLMQYEKAGDEYYFPAYHNPFTWDFKSVGSYGGKKFAHFRNVHQASFILTKKQLKKIGKKINFCELVVDRDSWLKTKWKNAQIKLFDRKFIPINIYSRKCKVNTDIYNYGGFRKMICISEFEDNLIHHLPNLYINGEKGRRQLRADQITMFEDINLLLK